MDLFQRTPKRDQRFVIQNWKDFRTFMLPLSFPEKVDQLPQAEICNLWKQKFDQLIQSPNKLFYLCKPDTRQAIMNPAIDILSKDAKYRLDLGFEYQHLFLGNVKQLLIFIQNPSVVNYLRKYRPPDQYMKIRDKVSKIEDKVDFKIVQRNLLISLNPQEKREIQLLTEQIETLRDKELNQPMNSYKILLNDIFVDFKAQEKRKQMTLFITRRSHIDFIQKMCQDHQLYIHKKHIDVTRSQKYIDMEVLKQEPGNQDFSMFDTNYSDQRQRLHSKLGSIRLQKPKNIESLQFVSFQDKHKAYYKATLPFSSLSDPIDRIVVTNGLGEQFTFNIQKKQQDLTIQLWSYSAGVCSYVIQTENLAGRSSLPTKVSIIFSVNEDNKPLKDKVFYMLGQSDKFLIPKIHSENPQQTFIQSTEGKFVQTLFASEATIGSSVFVCDSSGMLAGWGLNYYQKVDQQSQDQKADPFINSLDLKILRTSSRVQSPSIFDKDHNICRVSCGQLYLLTCNRLGQVWAMGSNTVGQLGLGCLNVSVKTNDLILVRQLVEQKAFIVDVKATKNGGSIALDKDGRVYRWGLNQAQITSWPIKNRYGDIINYKVSSITQFAQPKPIPISKRYIFDPVIRIEAGKDFFLALTSKGQLYGWGNYEKLGLKSIRDTSFDEIQYICNPVLLMKSVVSISAGDNHTIAVKQDRSIYGWGDGKCFAKGSQQWVSSPVQLKDCSYAYESIVCGPDFTVFYRKLDNEVNEIQPSLEVVGCEPTFKIGRYVLPGQVSKIVCGQGVMGVLIQQ